MTTADVVSGATETAPRSERGIRRERASVPKALPPPNMPLRAGLWMASRSLRLLGQSRYIFADGIGWGIYTFGTKPAAQRRCADNHHRLDPTISDAEARRRARSSYREFMRMSFDFVWMYAIPPRRMPRHSRTEGLDHVWRTLDQYGGGIFVLAHYGTWDVAAAIALSLGIRLTTVMTKVGDSDLATRIAAWARRHQDMEVLITGRGAARGLIAAVKRGRFDAILADIPDRRNRVVVDFCGGPVNFSTGPAWIARTTRVPILCVDCYRDSDGRHRMVIHPPIVTGENETDRDIMQRVARVLEEQIKKVPTQWYPFGDVYVDGGGTPPAGPPA
ncbi:MAG: lysophospholipid acyltransferase family protein [Candidatus Dormibacteria bacterium]